MDNSLATWLRLREPADVAARSASLALVVAAAMPQQGPVCVLDLATGRGSNIRYLAERLHGAQHWLAGDISAALLSDLHEGMSSWGTARGYDVRANGDGRIVRGEHMECHVETRQIDLRALDDRAIFGGRHLVTASALLDLVSESWLRALAAHCAAEGAAALFALTYNGRSSCVPAEPEDDMVRELLNRHQKRDKGLGGPAAGPDSVACAERCFAEAGYRVLREPSDWRLGPADAAMQRLLVEGWAQAGIEAAPEHTRTIASWCTRRLAHIDAGRSRVVVGHDDLAALPR